MSHGEVGSFEVATRQRQVRMKTRRLSVRHRKSRVCAADIADQQTLLAHGLSEFQLIWHDFNKTVYTLIRCAKPQCRIHNPAAPGGRHRQYFSEFEITAGQAYIS
jgi:hypothetical protein